MYPQKYTIIIKLNIKELFLNWKPLGYYIAAINTAHFIISGGGGHHLFLNKKRIIFIIIFFCLKDMDLLYIDKLLFASN